MEECEWGISQYYPEEALRIKEKSESSHQNFAMGIIYDLTVVLKQLERHEEALSKMKKCYEHFENILYSGEFPACQKMGRGEDSIF